MIRSNQIIVFDIVIDQKLSPKLYEYGVQNKVRLQRVLNAVKIYSSTKLEGKQIVEFVEKSESVLFLGVKIDVLEFPAIYCWYKENPKRFKEFFGGAVEKLWDGDTKRALVETEQYLEKDLK